MTAPASSSFWQMIDGAFVINLDQRADRWAQFQGAARNLIPAEKLHRLSACVGRDLPGFGQPPWFCGGKRDHTWAGRAGCLQSHRRALRQAREAGWRTVLLLEDDAEFSLDFTEVSDDLAAALQKHEWQICYLGFTEPWAPGRQLAKLNNRALHQIHGCTTTHAYLVRETARDWILRRLPEEANVWPWLATHRAIDRWYQRQLGLHFPVVCVSPSLVNQDDSASDIVAHATPATGGQPVIAPASGPGAYYLGHAFRRVSVRLGLAGDALRGWTRRVNGF